MTKVVIAEDDLTIAAMVGDVLVENGYEVCGIGRTVDAAVDLCLHYKPDLVLIDLRLADEGLGTDIAARLKGVASPGILYASGNMTQTALTSADGHACLTKPYRTDDLLRGLAIVSDIVVSGTARPPFPRGFHVLQPPICRSEALHGW